MATGSDELTVKQKRFVELYDGNATEAAVKAGYSQKYANRIAAQLMDNEKIVERIQEREAERDATEIMTREQRKIFWTAIARDESQSIRDRLRASELLGKSEGDFIDRKQITGKDGEPVTVASILRELDERTLNRIDERKDEILRACQYMAMEK